MGYFFFGGGVDDFAVKFLNTLFQNHFLSIDSFHQSLSLIKEEYLSLRGDIGSDSINYKTKGENIVEH